MNLKKLYKKAKIMYELNPESFIWFDRCPTCPHYNKKGKDWCRLHIHPVMNLRTNEVTLRKPPQSACEGSYIFCIEFLCKISKFKSLKLNVAKWLAKS
jgi:hypothetical protein